MTNVKFSDFHNQIRPFLQRALKEVDTKSAHFENEIFADVSRTKRLAFRAAGYFIAGRIMECAAGVFPSLKEMHDKIALRKVDCIVGSLQHDISTYSMARKLPESLRKQEWADYARSLSLPHIARVIDTASRPDMLKATQITNSPDL